MTIIRSIQSIALSSFMILAFSLNTQSALADETDNLLAQELEEALANQLELEQGLDSQSLLRFFQFNPLVGSWKIFITPDGAPSGFVNYATFNREYTSVSFGADGLGGVGTYTRVGRNRYAGEFSGPCGCAEFPQDTLVQISILVDYSFRTQQLSGRFITRIISANGEELAQFQGDARGERLNIDFSKLPDELL